MTLIHFFPIKSKVFRSIQLSAFCFDRENLILTLEPGFGFGFETSAKFRGRGLDVI